MFFLRVPRSIWEEAEDRDINFARAFAAAFASFGFRARLRSAISPRYYPGRLYEQPSVQFRQFLGSNE